MVGIVVVNDNSVVGFGKAKWTPGNADVAVSSASYCPFVCPPVPLGPSFSSDSSPEQALGLVSLLMMFVWGVSGIPKVLQKSLRVLGGVRARPGNPHENHIKPAYYRRKSA